MIDVFDIIAFAVFAVLLAAAVIIVVTLGSLPGQIARKRGHPYASAIDVASWLGIATLGLLWPLALICAFVNPSSAAPAGAAPRPEADPDAKTDLMEMQTRVDALEAALRELRVQKEMGT